MLVDFVVPERWYSVDEVAEILGFSRDTVIRLIENGFLTALVLPRKARRGRRIYSSRRIQGAEIIRFAKAYTSVRAA
jgi:excisionase family DNA binding protein